MGLEQLDGMIRGPVLLLLRCWLGGRPCEPMLDVVTARALRPAEGGVAIPVIISAGCESPDMKGDVSNWRGFSPSVVKPRPCNASE